MPVSFVCKSILAETQLGHHTIVKYLRTSKVGNRNVDVVNADYLDTHALSGFRLICVTRSSSYNLCFCLELSKFGKL